MNAMPASMANPPFAFPASWKGVKRVLIEHCTYDDSALCKDTEYSQGCYNVRCTQKDDLTLESSLRSLLAFIRCVPRNIVVTMERDPLHWGLTRTKWKYTPSQSCQAHG